MANAGDALVRLLCLDLNRELNRHDITTSAAAKKAGKATPQYGAGPGGSGLTPAQTSSLYNATPVYQLGNRGKGQGATLAVFELSGYTPSDITTFEHQFYGPSENVKLPLKKNSALLPRLAIHDRKIKRVPQPLNRLRDSFYFLGNIALVLAQKASGGILCMTNLLDR